MLWDVCQELRDVMLKKCCLFKFLFRWHIIYASYNVPCCVYVCFRIIYLQISWKYLFFFATNFASVVQMLKIACNNNVFVFRRKIRGSTKYFLSFPRELKTAYQSGDVSTIFGHSRLPVRKLKEK